MKYFIQAYTLIFTYFDFFSVCFRAEGKIKHCKIYREGRLYTIGTAQFESLIELVEFYEKHPLYRKIKLKHPINEEVDLCNYVDTRLAFVNICCNVAQRWLVELRSRDINYMQFILRSIQTTTIKLDASLRKLILPSCTKQTYKLLLFLLLIFSMFVQFLWNLNKRFLKI